MPTHAPERPGLGEAAKSVAEHASAIARLELELATLELKRKLVSMGLGIGLLAGAAVFGVFGFMLLLALAAAALALVLPVWASIAIVLGGTLGLAGVLAVLGLGRVKKGSPPVPEQAIREMKLTTEAIKSNGRH
jgi:hypothetical protein